MNATISHNSNSRWPQGRAEEAIALGATASSLRKVKNNFIEDFGIYSTLKNVC